MVHVLRGGGRIPGDIHHRGVVAGADPVRIGQQGDPGALQPRALVAGAVHRGDPHRVAGGRAQARGLVLRGAGGNAGAGGVAVEVDLVVVEVAGDVGRRGPPKNDLLIRHIGRKVGRVSGGLRIGRPDADRGNPRLHVPHDIYRNNRQVVGLV